MNNESKINLFNSNVADYVLISFVRSVISDPRVTFKTTAYGAYVYIGDTLITYITKEWIHSIITMYDFDFCDMLRSIYRDILKLRRYAKH